jgi:hypothetical protein
MRIPSDIIGDKKVTFITYQGTVVHNHLFQVEHLIQALGSHCTAAFNAGRSAISGNFKIISLCTAGGLIIWYLSYQTWNRIKRTRWISDYARWCMWSAGDMITVDADYYAAVRVRAHTYHWQSSCIEVYAQGLQDIAQELEMLSSLGVSTDDIRWQRLLRARTALTMLMNELLTMYTAQAR